MSPNEIKKAWYRMEIETDDALLLLEAKGMQEQEALSFLYS